MKRSRSSSHSPSYRHPSRKRKDEPSRQLVTMSKRRRSDHSRNEYDDDRKDEVHRRTQSSRYYEGINTFNAKRQDHVSSSSSRSSQSTGPSLDRFEAKQYKRYFDQMFFRDRDCIIKRDSQEYNNFWKFYEQFVAFQNRTRTKEYKTDADTTIKINGIKVPSVYHKKYTVPFRLSATKADDYIYKLHPEDQAYVRKHIPLIGIEDFLQVLLYFLNLLLNESFAELKKLRQTQAALPIAQFRESILEHLEKHNVLIIAGDTGCGKSTQVPQYLLKAGYVNIACTQPRRIACISLCKRVSFETLSAYGSEVGYQIRFEKSKTQRTKMVFITEGLLLRQVTSDSLLSIYNVIVLDEVHERHLHGDFLLGIVKCLLYQRQDIKIILMSATINTELFQEYFQGLAPILKIPGRLYPIEVKYRPVSIEELTTKTGKLNPAPYVRILQLVDDKYQEDDRGDVLMFLSGVNEISTVVEAAMLYAQQTKRWIVLPLHSMLSIDDQDKAFDYPPEGTRKCIVATNIAETSITIDGIRFVVDSGKVKEMAYDSKCRMQRLKEFWVSRASAEQRKGRAGRTGPGVCYRLYSETEYQELQPYSTPEIQRVPLDSLILQMISLGISDCRKFPFIEPPALDSIESSVARLKSQGALNNEEQLTPIGKTLSSLPVDVTIGKMLIMGTLFEQIDAVLSLAAALSVQTPFTNYAHRDSECVNARKDLDSDHGDPLTLLNAYRAWLVEKSDPSNNSRRWCKRRGLEEQRFYEMTKLRQQFQRLLKDSALIESTERGFSVSSSERSMRYGEMKQLKSLKREYHIAAPRMKKILKLHLFDEPEAEDGNNDEIDIRDVDFKLRNDSTQVRDLLSKSTTTGYEDISILKLIMCSGIYPQVAVADDFNKFKSDVDQVFHTKDKGFTVLHPMGIFANQSDVLKLNESDIIQLPHMNSKLTISSKHQLLCYLTLLETNKPYIMNTFRLPAVQTLLLFSHSVDTDPTFTRFVFDSWLEVEFSDSSTARSLLVHTAELRDAWTLLLEERLSEGNQGITDKQKRKSFALGKSLMTFLRSEAFYSIRRLLAADQKDLYNRQSYDDGLKYLGLYLERKWKVIGNPMKGGISLTSYITYSSLYGPIPDPEEWTCSSCEKEFVLMPLELLFHQHGCRQHYRQERDDDLEQEEMKQSAGTGFSKSYLCRNCNQTLHLTSIEILRHKRTCIKIETANKE